MDLAWPPHPDPARARRATGTPPAHSAGPRPATRWVRTARVHLWRARHLAAALFAITLAWFLVRAFAPPPAGASAVVLATEIRAGHELGDDDVTSTLVPAHVLPADALTELADVTGAALVIDATPGTVITRAMLAGPQLAAGLDPGQVAVPVTFTDRGSRSIARVGQVVWLYASRDGTSTRVGADARILAILPDVDSSALDYGGTSYTDALVAVRERDATLLVEALSEASIRAVLPARPAR
ncbi:MAG: SAF domain-containing protein [Bowdeniella nasicola]|nr:SAF domain-containing protein [Bowdeniella nasicola]